MQPSLETSVDLKVIGIARTPYQQRFGVPRQPGLVPEACATLDFFSEFQPELSLLGLEMCSHVWVIYLFHKNPSSKFLAKATPPRLEGAKLGVFATRSPNRPNPIGLSLVRVKRVGASEIEVSGVDFLDGTPLLDIKPYLKDVEAPMDAFHWSDGFASDELDIAWAPQAEESFDQWVRSSAAMASEMNGPQFRTFVNRTLQLDPRPHSYKDNSEKYQKRFFTRMAGADIEFQYEAPHRITVLNLVFGPTAKG